MRRTQGALLVLFAVLAPAGPAVSGEPWEAALERGVREQRAAERRGVSPDALVGRAERAARRDGSVANLYLVARAYGVRAQWHREEARKAGDEAERRRHLQAADADHASAMAANREVLQAAPRCYFAWHAMGVLVLQANPQARSEAHEHFRQAWRVNPNHLDSVRQIVKIQLAERRYDQAIPLLEDILRSEPGDHEARAHLVRALALAGRTDEAYRHLKSLEGSGGTNPPPAVLVLRAQVDLAARQFDHAIETWRRLARENPNVPMAFLGILEVVQAQTDGKLRPDSRDVLFALRGLLRIERDEANRARLVEDIRRIEHELAAPAGEGNGSPATLEQLLHALKSPDAGQRAHALLRLMLRKEDPTPATVRAIAGHVAPSAEPEPAVRAGAVRALGRMSGSVLAPLLRASIEDPDERVQVEAVDTLTAVARRDAAIVGAVVAVLGRYAEGGATERATAARQAVLSLTGTTLDGVGDESDPAAWRAAFLAWWRGPRGIDERVRALAGYQRLGDATPYQILAHYVEAEDFFVFREAVRALRAAAAQPADERQRAWYGRMPDAAEAALTQERWQASRAAFRAWLADAP